MSTSSSSAASAEPKKLSARRQRRAAEILDVAQACFLEKGFDGTAVSEIAQRAGIAEGLVFSYYATKRDLLHAVLASMYGPLIRDLEEGCQRMRGLRATLRFIIWRHLRVFLETPRMARLILHEVRSGPEYFSSGLHDLHVRYTQPLLDTLNEAIRNGELAADLPLEMVRSSVYGTIEHLMWPVLYSRRTIDLETTADQLTELLLSGLSAVGCLAHKAGNEPTTGASIDLRLQRIEAMLEQLPAANAGE
ncbi:TetR/AcrR family transcriptional regulator [Aromatoleum toluclasticum]|uniref:TetR/AcrR family transcriptional regulator n=1 Tax=Aromatoleum toluclasticum TaxID=92003 RepID=UPI001D190CB9|nr:TetR/AcrR family transcriptional regulator [Aromatoleum toluclasticum]MCC4113962.1 TetR/AcrR family transcriptional regulator [Aromatoleum toluclasticum]